MTASNTVPEECSYRIMSMDSFIREFQQVNEKGSYARKFCFVLGAGTSISSGIPFCQTLIDIWDQELKLRDPLEYEAWRREKGITDENKYIFFNQYYAKYFGQNYSNGFDNDYNHLKYIIDHVHPQLGHVMLALIMQRAQNNIVITTNYDHLMDDSVIQFDKKTPLIISHVALSPYLTDEIMRPVILRVHQDPLCNHIRTPEELSQLDEKWDPTLDHIFTHYHPVFIGYTGNGHGIMNYLTQNIKKFTDGTWCYPYWMIYGDQEPEQQVAEFLKRSGAFLIRHDGFDNIMIRLGLKLYLNIPSKEEMIEQVRKQYQERIGVDK